MDNKIRNFWERHIRPIDRERSRQMLSSSEQMPEGIDSYFTAPLRPDYLYLNSISIEADDLAEEFKHLWEHEAELRKCIPDLMKLAFLLKQKNIQQSEELSPFMYVMF